MSTPLIVNGSGYPYTCHSPPPSPDFDRPNTAPPTTTADSIGMAIDHQYWTADEKNFSGTSGNAIAQTPGTGALATAPPYFGPVVVVSVAQSECLGSQWECEVCERVMMRTARGSHLLGKPHKKELKKWEKREAFRVAREKPKQELWRAERWNKLGAAEERQKEEQMAGKIQFGEENQRKENVDAVEGVETESERFEKLRIAGEKWRKERDEVIHRRVEQMQIAEEENIKAAEELRKIEEEKQKMELQRTEELKRIERVRIEEDLCRIEQIRVGEEKRKNMEIQEEMRRIEQIRIDEEKRRNMEIQEEFRRIEYMRMDEENRKMAEELQTKFDLDNLALKRLEKDRRAQAYAQHVREYSVERVEKGGVDKLNVAEEMGMKEETKKEKMKGEMAEKGGVEDRGHPDQVRKQRQMESLKQEQQGEGVSKKGKQIAKQEGVEVDSRQKEENQRKKEMDDRLTREQDKLIRKVELHRTSKFNPPVSYNSMGPTVIWCQKGVTLPNSGEGSSDDSAYRANTYPYRQSPGMMNHENVWYTGPAAEPYPQQVWQEQPREAYNSMWTFPMPITSVAAIPPILFRVYDDTSVSKYAWNGFTAASQYMPRDATRFGGMVQLHGNWGSREGTPFVSVTSNPDAVAWHVANKKAQGNNTNIMVALINTAILLGPEGTTVWRMHDARDHFGLQSWKCNRRAFDDEYICALGIPARAIFTCCKPEYFMTAATLFLNNF